MKVACLVLAGGRGTRLFPLTWFVPKVLLPISRSERLIDNALRVAKSLNERVPVTTFVLAGYKGEYVQRYLCDRSNISVLREPKPLGTGGAIRHHWSRIRESNPSHVLVLCGDHYITPDLAQAVSALPINSSMTLFAVRSKELHHQYLCLAGNKVVDLNSGRQRKVDLAYCGNVLFRVELLERAITALSRETVADLTDHIVLPIIRSEGASYFLLDKPWEDLGTWKRYLKHVVNSRETRR